MALIRVPCHDVMYIEIASSLRDRPLAPHHFVARSMLSCLTRVYITIAAESERLSGCRSIEQSHPRRTAPAAKRGDLNLRLCNMSRFDKLACTKGHPDLLHGCCAVEDC